MTPRPPPAGLVRVRVLVRRRGGRESGPVKDVHRVSSAAGAFSEASAASMASSNPAWPRRADSRADALST
jgi:hypothetical protein